MDTTTTTGSTKKGLQRTGLKIEDHMGQLLLPGDEIVKPVGDKLILGPGLRMKHNSPDTITADRAGILAKSKDNTYYLEVKRKNYTHFKKDDVIGIIINKKADNYICDIGTRDRVRLSKFAFEGATKRNKPNLKLGDVVYGRFIEKPKDLPLEMTCVNYMGRSVGMGALEKGYLFQVPVYFVRVLRSPKTKNSLLGKIGQATAFESVVSDNGFIWINSKNMSTTYAIALLLQAAATEHSTTGQIHFPELLKDFQEFLSSSRS